jgi:hypothetical protein
LVEKVPLLLVLIRLLIGYGLKALGNQIFYRHHAFNAFQLHPCFTLFLFSKELVMNRRLLFVLVLVMACFAVTAPVMAGSSLTFVSNTAYPLPYPDETPAFNITAEGNLDWLIINQDQKADANIIATQTGTNLPTTSPIVYEYQNPVNIGVSKFPPAFSFTDGQNPTSSDYLRSDIAYNGVATDIILPAGSGSLSIWWVYVPINQNGSQFTLAFDGGASYTVPLVPFAEMESPRKTVINWQTDAPQTLHFSALTNAGINAIAVSQVPEPGTLTLLVCGLAGLIAYAWRKQK